MSKRFTEEFKQEAIRLVREEGLSNREVSEDLGLGKSTLAKWLQRAGNKSESLNSAKPLTELEREELKRLRKENNVLKMERDILKKATAFFAKTS